jgi:hypothetical protein
VFTVSTTLRRVLAITTALSMFAPVLPAAAQDDTSTDTATSAAAPPARVGEIASVTGSVSYNGAGSSGQWIAATANYPLTSGDSLFTQTSAEAAIAVDSSRIDLAASTELQMTGLDDTTVAATESQGEVFLNINYLQPGQSFVITTPRGAVTINQNGNYDIAAGDANNPTVVTVLTGEATVTDPGATVQVQADQAAVLSGTDQTTAQVGPAQRDDFINEMMAEIAPPPPAYAPPVVQQMTGVSELGNYGSWNQDPQYGAVWYPSVDAGWTPYREGHWAYVAPWGYTWVESEPWGFAPFHYGRWIQEGPRWGWAPAPDYSNGGYGGYGPSYQPVYAPAVVSFFGAGIAVGFTIGALNSGSVGWVPLGPDEPYYPNYRCSPDYIRRINVVNVRNIDIVNIHNTTINNYNYGTLRNRRGATYMPASYMSRGEPVSRYGRPAPDTILASARPVGPEGFRPGPGQTNGGHGPVMLPPPAFQHRPAPAPQPTSFGERHHLPPAVISHQPPVFQDGHFTNTAVPGVQHPGFNNGQPPVQHPGFNGGQPQVQHPGFATMPGYHAPPPPPNGGMEHPGQPMTMPGTHPESQQHQPMPQVFHPGMQPPTPPAQGNHPMPQVFHPGMQPPAPPAQGNHPTPQMFHPQEPAQQYHPPVQENHPMPQVYEPHQTAPQYHPPVEQYHPPVQQYHPPVQQYHPPVQEQQYHPPVQEFHPQPQQPQFHPQPQQPPQHQDQHQEKHPG